MFFQKIKKNILILLLLIFQSCNYKSAHPPRAGVDELVEDSYKISNGKNEIFERPVVIVKAYNTEMLKIVPLTTRAKTNKFHLKIKTKVSESYIVLTQQRVISAKRLLRKIDDKISVEDFDTLKQKLKEI